MRPAVLAIVAGLAAVALAVAPASAQRARSASALTTAQQNYLSIAKTGVKKASHWANRKFHWYNRLLTGNAKSPLATIWDIVPLWESVDYIGIASPTKANLKQVKRFAVFAEKYWDKHIAPAPGSSTRTAAYAPYPGAYTNENTWFDDNSWFGLAFMDAAQAEQASNPRLSARFQRDAQRAFQFVSTYAWDQKDGGGLWWNTCHNKQGEPCPGQPQGPRSGEAIAAATNLATRLYAATNNGFFLSQATKFITWAEAHLDKQGTFGGQTTNANIMPNDGEGAMLAAFTNLCAIQGNGSTYCRKAESLAQATVVQPTTSFLPLDSGPQFDAIYLRGLLTLYDLDHNSKWYYVASDAAKTILANARTSNGLFLNGWRRGEGTPKGCVPGMIRTHGASVSVFAALAATTPPA